MPRASCAPSPSGTARGRLRWRLRSPSSTRASPASCSGPRARSRWPRTSAQSTSSPRWTTRRSPTSARSGCAEPLWLRPQGVGLRYQRLPLRHQRLRLLLADGLSAELCAFECGDHLSREGIALVGERDELVLDVRVRAVTG